MLIQNIKIANMLKFKIIIALFFWIAIVLVSCNKDDISFDAPNKELRFSRDTVFCDTVYNQVRSETYAVKVYNTEDRDVMIPKIELGRGSGSLYRINVDGKSGFQFLNTPLRKKDSLYIFVEIAPTANGPEAIAEDQILFSSNQGTQHVTLFSVVQDAEFFVQTTANPVKITSNTVWNNNKAKIIYGNLQVDPGVTLDVQAGTKVYFHKNSGLKIANAAKLNVNGTLGNEVVFRGDRNDTKYDTIPKNWNEISFDAGASLNMNYAKIFGGTRGLDMKQTTANISNSIIHTFQEYGIYAVNSTIAAKNIVMDNFGDAAIGMFKGGYLNLTQCTLANFWEMNSSTNAFVLYATNDWTNPSGQVEQAALNMDIKNSILYNKNENAVQLKPTNGQVFNYSFTNSLLKYSNTAGFAFDNNPFVINSIKNENPLFLNLSIYKLNLSVANASPARNKGNLTVAASVPLDIVGVSRLVNPTLGAYQ
jgi:hypothetical protein